MSTINAKKDKQNAKMANRAANLQALVQAVWAEKEFAIKQIRAVEMSEAFEVGGKEDFVRAVFEQTTNAGLDKLATNAMLKGEGMSTKRW